MKPTEILSIIIPFHNEQEVIGECQQRISAAVAAIDMQVEILYVNDGSKDDSLDILIALMQQDQRIKIIELSRNFGKETAMTAGLDEAKGAAVVIIDADLQDPPELIA
ncbi:glycosyl transferase, group 2 family protein, partial [methanotrophic bacterial endosymbiont of Bathymodiolus sp.]